MKEFANVWPRGGLFAFSGVDGETCHAEPFVASGTMDGIGWQFWVKPKLTISAEVGLVRLVSTRQPSDFCFSDCWRCSTTVEGFSGEVEGAFVDRSSMAVRLAFRELPDDVSPEFIGDGAGRYDDDLAVFPGEGWWIVICRGPRALERQYGIAISYTSEAEATQRAQAAQAADVAEVIRERLAYYEAAPVPDSVADNKRRTYYKAISVQKVNIESTQGDIPCRWTTPDRMPHRHMWLWDSAFHALGLNHVRRDLAQDALRALFSKQRADGKLLLAAQPGTPPREEDDTQPPVVAWSLWRQSEEEPDRAFLEEVYPNLVHYLEWFEKNRRNANGLYGWQVRADNDPVRGARGGESGMDNSPRFDRIERMTAVDLSSYMAGEYRAMYAIARALGDEDAAEAWEARRVEIAEGVNRLLWDDEDRIYYDLDGNGEFILLKTSAGLTPLHGLIPDHDRAEALRLHLRQPHEFWSAFPVPSVSQDEDVFCQDMWRGPTWPNMNVIFYHALMAHGFYEEAREIAHKTINELARWYRMRGCLYEYYDSTGALPPPELPRKGAPGDKGGVGFGVVADLHWTAASFVHFAHETA